MAGDDGVARDGLPARVTASDSSSVEKSDAGAPKVLKKPASKKDETPNQPTDDEHSPLGGSRKDDETDDGSGHGLGSEEGDAAIPKDLKVSKKPAARTTAAKKRPATKQSRRKDRPMNTGHQWNQCT
jgi:hypothetical protein